MSDNDEETTDITTIHSEDRVPRGATCSELTIEPNEIIPKEAISELPESDIEELNTLPSPPWIPYPLNATFRGDINHSRRLSTLMAPSDADYSQFYHRIPRHTSLPSIPMENDTRFHHDYDLKKVMMDSSRRSSFESAYHSQRSDPMSRTPISSRFEYINDSDNYHDDINYMSNQPYPTYEEIQREITDRRNSLSYDAIRSYFLERNPYIHVEDQYNHCLDHGQLTSVICPRCHRRRSNIGPSNLFFRTNAHQAVIERQFEDLFNIPGPNRSRSTSIDLFGGMHVPVNVLEDRDQLNHTNENVESNDDKVNDNKENLINYDENQMYREN